MSIGEQIQKMRIQRGLTQERIAEMLEVSRQSVSKWELGQAIPDVEKIITMSKLFDVSTYAILFNKSEEYTEKKNRVLISNCVNDLIRQEFPTTAFVIISIKKSKSRLK